MGLMITDDMPPKMKRFMSRKPRKVRDRARSYPRGWLTDCLKIQKRKCFYCRGRLKFKPLPDEWHMQPTIDHVVPISAGGQNKRDNVVAACVKCNSDKGSRPVDEFMKQLKARYRWLDTDPEPVTTDSKRRT
jgi:5-methylcytosine-specific restriction endonuclease McrA